jgi:hypothetical protein
MQIDKDQILGLLRGDGKHDEADQAQSQLPDKVDTDKPEHSDLLSKFGLNIDDLKGKLGGLGNLL